MGGREKRVDKVIWRALGRHVEAGHKLEVRQFPDGEDLEMFCCWCGVPVMFGTRHMIRQFAGALKEAGVEVVDVAGPVIEAM